MKQRRKLADNLCLFLFTVLGALVLFPVVYTVAGSFMSPAEVLHYYQAVQSPAQGAASARLHLVPDLISLESFYQILLRRPDYLIKFWNSLLLCAGAECGRAVRFDRCIAGVLLLCAFALRVQSLWAAMPLLAAYGVLAWLESPRSGRKTALCCGMALALLGLLTAADSALYRHNEPGWDAFCAFNDRLSDLLDYNNTGLVDELAAEAAGWPSWTTYMVRNWYQLDEHMTLDSLTILTDAIAEAKPAPTAASLLRATGSVLLRYPMFAFTLAGFSPWSIGPS